MAFADIFLFQTTYLIAIQSIALFSSGFIFAELLHRSKIRAFFTFQKGIVHTKKNILTISKVIGKKGTSSLILCFGNKIFNFHHSRFGWLLAAISVAIANLWLFVISSGLIIHHIIREKKIF